MYAVYFFDGPNQTLINTYTMLADAQTYMNSIPYMDVQYSIIFTP